MTTKRSFHKPVKDSTNRTAWIADRIDTAQLIERLQLGKRNKIKIVDGERCRDYNGIEVLWTGAPKSTGL